MVPHPFFSTPGFPSSRCIRGLAPDGGACRPASARRRRELERIVETPRELVFELRPVAGDTQVASTRDSAVVGVQQSFGERQGVTDTQTKCLVQLASEGEVNERNVRNPSRDAALLAGHVRHRKVGDGIVEPLLR